MNMDFDTSVNNMHGFPLVMHYEVLPKSQIKETTLIYESAFLSKDLAVHFATRSNYKVFSQLVLGH